MRWESCAEKHTFWDKTLTKASCRGRAGIIWTVQSLLQCSTANASITKPHLAAADCPPGCSLGHVCSLWLLDCCCTPFGLYEHSAACSVLLFNIVPLAVRLGRSLTERLLCCCQMRQAALLTYHARTEEP